MMDSGIEITETIPSPEEYCGMRKACGLSEKTLEAAKKGLPRSLYAVSLRSSGKLIGTGRIVGDGLHVQVVDIAVHPDFQKRGLSKQILQRIVAYAETQVPKCAVVSLFADVDWLYEKFGFGKPERSVGMFYKRD